MRLDFVERVEAVMAADGGTVEYVELVCPVEELKRRMDQPSRESDGKLTSLPLFEELLASGDFDCAHMPAARMVIDASTLEPIAAAVGIAKTLGFESA